MNKPTKVERDRTTDLEPFEEMEERQSRERIAAVMAQSLPSAEFLELLAKHCLGMLSESETAHLTDEMTKSGDLERVIELLRETESVQQDVNGTAQEFNDRVEQLVAIGSGVR